MPKTLFYIDDLPYHIYSIHDDNCIKDISIKKRETLGKIYSTCFGGTPRIEKISDLNSFTEGRGITIVITDHQDNTVFIISIII